MKRMTPLILQRKTLKMSIIKKITALNMTMVILTASLTACGSFDTEDIPETPEVTTPLPETYEDYMKLAAESYGKQDWETALASYQSAKELDESREDVYRGMSDVYLHMDDVVQALAILDEGIEKCSFNSSSQNMLSQRKEYVLAGMVAVRTKFMENEYDDEGNILPIYLLECDENGNIGERTEHEYDTGGNLIKTTWYDKDGEMEGWAETEYDDAGNTVKYERYNENGSCTRKIIQEYDEYGKQTEYIVYDGEGNITEKEEREYDENGNEVKYLRYSDAITINCWYETEYDESGKQMKFVSYNSEGGISYMWEYGYDENGLIISYTGYNKKEDDFVRRETEYDESGNVIRESYYDEDNDLIQYYENEYDDFGSITRQAMYEDGILKSEKQMSYVYRYIGNIDADAADYMDNEMSPEEYNLKQREIFTRFLNGQETIRYCCDTDGEEYGIKGGKIAEETITDFVDFEYVRQDTYTRNYKRGLEYTFLDMTGDGIEELLISCGGERLCVIQCSYGVLKVIYDMEERDFNTYLVKCNGRTGICCAFYIPLGDWSGCCFLDGRGKKEIFLNVFQDEYVDWTEYRMRDNDSFEERDISKGEYYDIMSGVVTKTDIDWQKLEKPLR